MTYLVNSVDDFKTITTGAYFYYSDEALSESQVRPNPSDLRPRVFGAVVIMHLSTDPQFYERGLARVVVNPIRQVSGFSGAINISVLDTDRTPRPDSSAIVRFDADRTMFTPVGSKGLFTYREPNEHNGHIAPSDFIAIRGFFIREPRVIRR